MEERSGKGAVCNKFNLGMEVREASGLLGC